MSVISQFNKLDGKTVSIKKLHDLQDKAYDEHQNGNKKAFEVWKRIQNLLDNYPKATVFTLEIENPISEKSSLGSSINKIVKGNELIYYQDKQKLATIKDNGVITYHKKRLPSGLRNEIRKAANIIGLSSPYSENPVDESMLNGLEYIPEEVEFTGLGKPVSQNDIYNYVTDLIINTIKKVGHLPWQKEWIGGGSENEAKNYVTKKTYNGINFLLLNFDIKYDKLTGYNYLVPIKFEQPYYLTFNQIEEAGAKLKAGSKARRVIYYTMIFSYKNGDLEISTTDKAKYSEFIKSNGITAQQIKEFGKKIPVIKYYNVYRADDCIGLKFPPKPKPKKTTPIEQAQAIIDGYPNPPKYTFVGADAYYQPANDLVNMPKIAAFTKEEFYYSTFFHEIIHSTGHSKRLDRGNDTRKRDGGQEDKKAYAFEELVAELGAVFLCSEAGILFTTVENSAKYLKGWNSRLITELENDNRFFLKASAQAQKAANWILDRNQDEVKQRMKQQFIEAGKVGGTKKREENKKPKVVSSRNPRTKKSIYVDTVKGKIIPKPVSKTKIKLTPAQKKRYDKELASDNWKKYSKNPDGNKKYKVRSNQYLKKGKASTYYYIVDDKGQSINKVTGKVYKGKNLELYAFSDKGQAQNIANEMNSAEIANNSKNASDIAKKNEKNATIKPKQTPKTQLSDYDKQEISVYVQYLEYKERNPKHIIFMPFEDVYLTFNDDAKKVSEIVDIPLHRKEIDGKHYFKAVFPAGMLKLNIARLLKAGNTVGVVEIAQKKSKKSTLGNSIYIHELPEFNQVPEIPVYLNSPIDETTREIIEIVKETIPAKAIVVDQPVIKPKNRLMQMTFDSLQMDEGWEKLMQSPAKNMKIAIWGAPKNGKTAGSLKLANYLTKFGNVLYNFADQGFNKSTQDLWIKSGLADNTKAEPSDISNLDDLEKEIKTGKYDFVFIDMISDYIRTEKVRPEEFKERFIKQFPNVSFILIFEVTKGGNFKGDQGWTHLVDAIMTVEDFLMENRGRYGAGEFVVWEEGFERFNPKRYAEWLENNAETIEPEEEKIFTEQVEKI
ncbi:MAG: zincin-like metallopeptidase domain-containing protein [Flavobacterium sp.]|uniref:zincin-like metallopeptidase domain-containing protein n=1 Tax=Flavobacterium sp. TaxID=239 RepID=UPI00391DF40F